MKETPLAVASILAALVIGVYFFGVGIRGCIDTVDREHREMVAACEAKGGVILDRTYTHGKGQTGHDYTCIDKNAIK